MALASSASSVFGSLSGLVKHSSSISEGSRNADGVPLETQQAIFGGQLRISCVGSVRIREPLLLLCSRCLRWCSPGDPGWTVC